MLGAALALDAVVPHAALGAHAAEPGARVGALEVLAHEVGRAVGVPLALGAAVLAKVAELTRAEGRVAVARRRAVGVRAAWARVARVHTLLLRVAAARVFRVRNILMAKTIQTLKIIVLTLVRKLFFLPSGDPFSGFSVV